MFCKSSPGRRQAGRAIFAVVVTEVWNRGSVGEHLRLERGTNKVRQTRQGIAKKVFHPTFRLDLKAVTSRKSGSEIVSVVTRD